jgi:hypothetical protein
VLYTPRSPAPPQSLLQELASSGHQVGTALLPGNVGQLHGRGHLGIWEKPPALCKNLTFILR